MVTHTAERSLELMEDVLLLLYILLVLVPKLAMSDIRFISYTCTLTFCGPGHLGFWG